MLTNSQDEQAYMSLMRGLKELDLQGSYVPSDLVLIGDHAFPLAMNNRGQVLMAASLYGSGRIVILGHEGYLKAFPALVENAVTWLRGDGFDNLSVGVHRSVCAVANNLQKSSFQVEVVGAFSDKLGIGVYVTDAYSVGSDPVELVAFLKAGGGVLIAGQAWGWAADHPKENTLHQFDGNKVSGVAGIYFTKNCGEAENLPVYPQIPSSWMSVDFEDDLQFLLQGISEFELPLGSTASEVLVHGPLAFPIDTTHDGRAFLAGAYYGQGRVILISHEGFLGLEVNSVKIPLTLLTYFIFQACFLYQRPKRLSILHSIFGASWTVDFWIEISDIGPGICWSHSHSLRVTILNQMGLSLLGATIGGGTYKALVPSQTIKDSYHFRHLLNRFAAHVTAGEKLSQHEERYLKKLGNDCNVYLQMKAHDSSHYRQVLATVTDILITSGLPEVSRQHNMIILKKFQKNETVLVDFSHAGLYLSPGMKTYMAIPPQIVNKDWMIQIGCQTDSLHHNEELKRPPSVHERFPVTAQMIQVWNLWGGLIYLVAPPKTQVKGLEVIVQMAVPAPYYKSGESVVDRTLICVYPTGAIADLAAKPHKFPRKERFVTDVQISHGYPIMAHKMTDHELVGVKKGNPMWGPIHELGHNQQRACWEFPPNTTECTCNLWSVYVNEEVLGIGREKPSVKQGEFKKCFQSTLCPHWSAHNTTTSFLSPHLQLQEKFGWDAFKKVFTPYHHIKDFPSDNKGKMNLYAETFSQTVGIDLTGFFKAWGWPIETATKGKLSQLPSWNDHPMTQVSE
uniref:Peptidase M60 domain-containing protein n=1 Tax=Neolamprologus brichardi TaxID=32507 RepID=A0A3Q4M426_NEOBR